MRVPPRVTVPAGDAAALRTWIDGAGATAARRARIVLLSGEGLGPTAISDELNCSKQTVITWRERYRDAGIAGLVDAPRPGRPATISVSAVVRRTLQPPPGGASRWTTRSLGADLGVSNVSVANVWRAWGIAPGGPGRVWLGTEPGLDGRFGRVTGLYLGPSVRVLALRATAAVSGGAPCECSELGDRLSVPVGETADRAQEFASQAATRAGTVLIADRECGGVGSVMHTVPPSLSFDRLAQVACWIVATNGPGAESVHALRTALDARRPGAALFWLPA